MALLAVVFLLGYIVLSVGLLYVLLCGKSEFHRDGLVGRCHTVLTMLPTLVLRGVGILCGKKGQQCCSKIEDCCCYSRNPFMQILYVVLSSLALMAFLLFIWPEIPNDYLSHYHKISVPVCIIWAYAVFLIACYSDPGTVTPENEELYRQYFEFDYVVYYPKYCSTTRVVRPARSKTCRICRTCVAKFDHHCVWLNSDVGLNNYRYFLLFLASTSIICFYGVYICGTVLLQTLMRDRLLSAVFVTSSGQRFKATIPIILQYMLHNYMATIFLAIFLFAVGVAIGGFFLYHLLLASTNVTTNETFKWQEIRRNLKQIQKKIEKGEKIVTPESQTDKSSAPDPHKLRQQQNLVRLVKEDQTVFNSYNRGVLANLWEVVYPPSSRPAFRVPKSTTSSTTPQLKEDGHTTQNEPAKKRRRHPKSE